ncbi:RluA family pseudouridine synthase [Hathewaya limosa]|uniref:Pseudouridine synthase n=1 Tax=Hathewaya limosa TaxID=1536 RepID=A0ABU0JRU4_HATLI|nr:RluA family pseudouridine synthase [Hathewaya limosa]MDQ0479823.1 23S rRNA pseudouridine1911/1915/1917 synthase [Hathewaya limosa]
MEQNIVVDKSFEGKRLDSFLAEYYEDKSRNYFQNLIDDEKVLVNNKIAKGKYKIKEGDNIHIERVEPKTLEVVPEDISLEILYEDEDVIVVNKPQDMVVHPAPGNYSGTLVNALLYHCTDLSGINGVIRPGIVHRIDKDTSGILVVAKNDFAHNALAEQLKEHSMNRIYIALCEGNLKEDTLIINKPIGRNPKNRLKMGVVADGKEAKTHVFVKERFKEHTLVQCKLETGRTHQIRVHMASIGHPLVGDPLYGFKKQKFNLQGQVLHAYLLGFIHPRTKEYMEFKSEIPEYFRELLKKI